MLRAFGCYNGLGSIFSAISGDWIVTGSEVVENKSIILNGNLIVKNGGSLTLSNVTLTLNNQYGGQYGISVELGGSLYIFNRSKISASNLKNGFYFVSKGSNFVMKDSELHGAGWYVEGDQNLCQQDAIMGTWPSPFPWDLYVESDGAVIENNTMSENAVGLTLTGSYATVERNIIHSNWLMGMTIRCTVGSSFINNSIKHALPFVSCMIFAYQSNNNTFLNNTLSSPLVHIGGNEIGAFGLNLINCWNNTVANNTISRTGNIWLQSSSNNIITGNTLTPFQYAIWGCRGVNN